MSLTIPSPQLSIIVIVFNMQREAPRTLFSLSTQFQSGVNPQDYEVIVIENGSTAPLEPDEVTQFGPNYRYFMIEDASPSPAAAINFGVAQSHAPFVGIMIDGARIATPGIVGLALQCLQHFEHSAVSTVGFHLGPDIQGRSMKRGYNGAVEDELLASIDWRKNGYRLFEIAAFAGSSPVGWLAPLAESNLIFLPRPMFDRLGGFDERFDIPGGGLVNLDFYRQVCELEHNTLITLLGEATFHQIHGGAITNKPIQEMPRILQTYKEQYQRIRGIPYNASSRRPLLFGPVHKQIIPWLQKSSDLLLKIHGRIADASYVPAPSAPPLPSDAVESESSELQPGSRHYRAYVGRPRHYDVVGAQQFSLLAMLGLREHHRLLDVGCGSLRGGRLFIPYLQAGHYCGIEPNQWLVEEGIAHEVSEQLVALKQPHFAHNDDFNLAVFDSDFDFILAQSIFSHTGLTQMRRCLVSARNVLKPDGLLVATFVEQAEDRARDQWVYPEVNFYRWKTLANLCAQTGFHCRKIDWPHPLQTWFVAALNLPRLEAITAAGVDFLPDNVILTGLRFAELKAGRFVNFYRSRKPPESP